MYSDSGTLTVPFRTTAFPSLTVTSQLAIVCLSIPHVGMWVLAALGALDVAMDPLYPFKPSIMIEYTALVVTSV